MTILQHYKNTAVPEDVKLLVGDDAITYSVLRSILQTTCTDIYTNHESVIVCYSTAPYPVWVWCRDLTNKDDLAALADCLKNAFPLENGFKYDISYELMDALAAFDLYFVGYKAHMGLLSYRNDQLLPPSKPADGHAESAIQEDFDHLCTLWHDCALEMEGFDHDRDFCANKVTEYMSKNNLFTWRDEHGVIAAITGRQDAAPYSKIIMVYTVPQYRRRGYAMHLVHHICEKILADGFTPILYTNANYPASNACYRKIGFRQVGSLCTASK